MRRLWVAAGQDMPCFEDTCGVLPKVLGYSRHDTLYQVGDDPFVSHMYHLTLYSNPTLVRPVTNSSPYNDTLYQVSDDPPSYCPT